jgi:hypothetical protein
MAKKIYLAIGVAACAAGWLMLAQNAAPVSGQWTIGGTNVQDGSPNSVQLTLRRTTADSSMSSSMPVEFSRFRGLSRPQLDSSGTVAQFELVREAGTFRFEGYVKSGGGGGTFTFAPDAKFASEMASLGFTGISGEKVFSLALHDVTAAYVRNMSAVGVRPNSTDQLITLRVHDVTVDYVKDLKAIGYADLTPDKLVTMRIHGVTAEFPRDLKALGYNSVSPDQLVTMRIHGATTDFIRQVAALGYNHPGIDQLVAMRIHGISPDYIRKARSQVGSNLSIDQLVSLKIHGIVE